MSDTTRKQKIFLILFSILLTLVVLEAGLRLGGAVFNFFLEKDNRVTFEGNEFRILCIGESTTAMGGKDSYPYQLEEILNKKRPDVKFEVINKGIVSTNSSLVLAQLNENLKKYKPHLVISMLGINDYLVEANKIVLKSERLVEGLRVYQLFALLGMHLREKVKSMRPSSSLDEDGLESIPENFEDHDDVHIKNIMDELDASLKLLLNIERSYSSLMELFNKIPAGPSREKIKKELAKHSLKKGWVLVRIATYYRKRKEYLEAEKYSKIAIAQSYDNYGGYVELGRVYKEQQEYEAAIPFFKKAMEIDPSGILAAVDLVRCYYALGRKEDVIRLSKIIYEKNTQRFHIYEEVGPWVVEMGDYELAEKMFLKGIARVPYRPVFYERLAELYNLQGKTEKAEEFSRKGKRVRQQMEGLPPVTANNYNDIANKVFARKIPLICMQYPRRDIQILKDMFWVKYPVIFVENKTNFEEALITEQYSEYFSDSFGGNFGHGTRKGNYLIAENLSDVIISQVLPAARKE